MSDLQKSFKRIKHWRSPTARERAAISILVAIAALSLTLGALELRSGLKEEAQQKALSHANLDKNIALGDARAIAFVHAEMKRAQRVAILAPTAEVAQFQAHSMLKEVAAQAGVTGVQILDAQIGNLPEGASHIRLDISGNYDQESFLALLRALSSKETLVFISNVRVDSRTRPHFEIELNFAYLNEDRPW